MDGVGSSISVAGWHLHGVQVIYVDCDLWRGINYFPLTNLDGCPLMAGKLAFCFLNVAFKAFCKIGPPLPSCLLSLPVYFLGHILRHKSTRHPSLDSQTGHNFSCLYALFKTCSSLCYPAVASMAFRALLICHLLDLTFPGPHWWKDLAPPWHPQSTF